MSEINFSALSRPSNLEKASNSVAAQKNASVKNPASGSDSVQFSGLPDLSAVEAAIEKEFESVRAKFEAEGIGAAYPPQDTVDRLAALLAVDLDLIKPGGTS